MKGPVMLLLTLVFPFAFGAWKFKPGAVTFGACKFKPGAVTFGAVTFKPGAVTFGAATFGAVTLGACWGVGLLVLWAAISAARCMTTCP